LFEVRDNSWQPPENPKNKRGLGGAVRLDNSGSEKINTTPGAFVTLSSGKSQAFDRKRSAFENKPA
jgi:hypothetical protein